MGFSSWDCYECGHPLLSTHATNRINRWMNEGVVITRTGRMIFGDYDGYGRLDGEDINPEEPTWYVDLRRARWLVRMVATGVKLADLPAGTKPHWMDAGKDKVTIGNKWRLKEDIAKFIAEVDDAEGARNYDRSWERLLVYHQACWEVAGEPRNRPSKKRQSQPSEDQGHFFDEGTHDMPRPELKGAK